MKASDIRRMFDLKTQLERLSEGSPDTLLQKCSDEQLRAALYASTEVFRSIRKEVLRRGLWAEFTKKVEDAK